LILMGKNEKTKIVLSGLALASPIGNDIPAFFNAIRNTKTATAKITCMDSEKFSASVAAEVLKEKWNEELTDRDDRKNLFLNYTLEKLLNDRKRELEKYIPESRHLFLGTGIDFVNIPELLERFTLSGNEYFDFIPYYRNTYDIAKNAASKYLILGSFTVNVATCIASAQAIGIGYLFLKENPDNIAIVGGFDSMLNYPQYLGFQRLGPFSNWSGEPDKACRPFDKNRSGMILGEGAAVYTMQEARSADPENILAEVKGYASSMDGYLITDPEPSGSYLARAALRAIKYAGLSPSDIDCVHLHGTGTLKNDEAEANAMKLIFSEKFSEIPVFSLKGHIGHAIGACSALEVGAVIYSIKNQCVPITANFQKPDEKVPLNVIKGDEKNMRIQNVLKLNANIGGQNSALVIGKYEP